jgi:hypothetical protein
MPHMFARVFVIGILVVGASYPDSRPPSQQQLYGFVHVAYTDASAGYRTTHYVSQVVGYCQSPRRDGFRELERLAVSEADNLEAGGQIARQGQRKVSFNGGLSSRSSAETSRQYWIRTGAVSYASGLDAIYYPATVCSW